MEMFPKSRKTHAGEIGPCMRCRCQRVRRGLRCSGQREVNVVRANAEGPAMMQRNLLPWMTAVLVVCANLAQIAPGFLQLQDSATAHILRRILDPRLAWLLLAIVAILFALVLSRLSQRLVSLETEKRDIRRELQRSFRAEIQRYQTEAISSATIREARIRIGIGDYSGAIRAAVECYDAAQSGNPNAVAHAFDAIGDALEGSER